MLPIISFTTDRGSDVTAIVRAVLRPLDQSEVRVFVHGDPDPADSYYTVEAGITLDDLRQAMTSSLQTSSVVQVTHANPSPEMTPSEFMRLAQDLFSRPTYWTEDEAWIMNTLRGVAHIAPGKCLPTAVAEYMRMICAPVSTAPGRRGEPAPVL